MSFSIRYDPQHGDISVKGRGDLDSTAALQMALDIQQLAAQYACRRILMDMRLVKLTLCPLDVRLMIENAEKIGFDKSCKRAIVTQNRFSNFTFLRWMAQFKSHQLEVFSGLDEARQWLHRPDQTRANQ